MKGHPFLQVTLVLSISLVIFHFSNGGTQDVENQELNMIFKGNQASAIEKPEWRAIRKMGRKLQKKPKRNGQQLKKMRKKQRKQQYKKNLKQNKNNSQKKQKKLGKNKTKEKLNEKMKKIFKKSRPTNPTDPEILDKKCHNIQCKTTPNCPANCSGCNTATKRCNDPTDYQQIKCDDQKCQNRKCPKGYTCCGKRYKWKCCSPCPSELDGIEGAGVTPTADNKTLISDLPCLPGVGRFASSAGLGYYYECNPGDKHPILKKCLDHEFWNRETMWCENEYSSISEINEVDKNKNLIYYEPVLGRSVMLGDLYDSRRQLVMNGYSLWDQKKITVNKVVKKKIYSNTKFFAEKSQDDRLKTFDITAHLKLSFLGGMIQVGGSAHYLKDSRASTNIVRFNMMYDATTRTETLPMFMTKKVDYNDICKKIKTEKSGPTHVITSIEYGMKAVFVFQTEATSHEDAEELSGSLQIVVKSIPEFSIKGDAKAKFTKQEKKTISSMNVKLYGDFILKESPTTYNMSLKVYKNIPHYLGDEKYNYNKSSPVRIMLTPVGQICNDSNILLASITADLMTVASKMMADLNEEMVHVNTLENNFLSHKFVDVASMIGLFHQNLTIYKLKTETKLKDILPKIRGGDGEDELYALYNNYLDSAFNFDRAILFLKEKERELNTINSLFNDESITNGYIQIGDFALANINDALLHKTYVIIYWFRVLSNVTVTEDYLKNKNVSMDTWYNHFPSVGKAGYKWRQFRDFAIRNKNFLPDQKFFIKGASIDNKTLSQISVYKNGINKTLDFKVPLTPPTPTIHSRSDNNVEINLGHLMKTDISSYVLEMFVNYRYTYQLSGKEMYSDYQNATFNIKDHNETGKILVTIFMPLERSIQIIKETTTPTPITTKTTSTKSTTTTKDTHTTKSITTSKPIITTKIVPVTYELFSAFQTSFGRGPNSDPLEIGKTVSKGICNCTNPTGCPLANKTLLTKLPVLSLQFFISFEFMAQKYVSGWQTIIGFTISEDGSYGPEFGQRIPLVSVLNDSKIQFCFSLDGNGNACTDTDMRLNMDKWHKVEFMQSLVGNKYIYEVSLDGLVLGSQENTLPAQFSDVQVWITNPGSTPLDGSVRNIAINGLGSSEPSCHGSG